MARTNYAFDKRQKDLAKKQKKEEKRLKKLAAKADEIGEELSDEVDTENSPAAEVQDND
ncbi:MAG: hypothetical protein JRG71_15510 [Deltaproteobacteria bacterium]|jgi:hypothetical protein|nr:hypothetical protein [Deltaproteobacteria bacterium]